MSELDEVCHCGLGPEDHKPGGAAEHSYVPKDSGTPPCRVCGLSEKVLCFPDNHPETVCPDCCDKAEHPDGEKGHQFTHDNWERDGVCDYCGILRRCTDHVNDTED